MKDSKGGDQNGQKPFSSENKLKEMRGFRTGKRTLGVEKEVCVEIVKGLLCGSGRKDLWEL